MKSFPTWIIKRSRQRSRCRRANRPGPCCFGSVILKRRPSTGPLFPYLATVRSSDRATEFKQRCKGLGITGVTLHSYRYGWAERARTAQYPLRSAQEALGQNSAAVHRAYAKNAAVTIPSLDEWEAQVLNRREIPPPAAEAPRRNTFSMEDLLHGVPDEEGTDG